MKHTNNIMTLYNYIKSLRPSLLQRLRKSKGPTTRDKERFLKKVQEVEKVVNDSGMEIALIPNDSLRSDAADDTRPLNEKEKKLLALLRQNPDYGITAIQSHFEMKHPSSAQWLVKQLIKKGYLVNDGRGVYRVIDKD